jgi:hypothetical protein
MRAGIVKIAAAYTFTHGKACMHKSVIAWKNQSLSSEHIYACKESDSPDSRDLTIPWFIIHELIIIMKKYSPILRIKSMKAVGLLAPEAMA